MATEKEVGNEMSKTWIPATPRLRKDFAWFRYIHHGLQRVSYNDGEKRLFVLDRIQAQAVGFYPSVVKVEPVEPSHGSVAQVVLEAYQTRRNASITPRHARKARKAYRAAKRLEGRSPWARWMMRELRGAKDIGKVLLDGRREKAECQRVVQRERDLQGVWPMAPASTYDTRPFDGATRNLRCALRLSAAAGELFREDVVDSVKADAVSVVAFCGGVDQPPPAWQALLRERGRSRATRRLHLGAPKPKPTSVELDVELGGPNGGATVLLPVDLFVKAFRRAGFAMTTPGLHRTRTDAEIAARAVELCAEPIGDQAVVRTLTGWGDRLRALRMVCAERVKVLAAERESLPAEEEREAS